MGLPKEFKIDDIVLTIQYSWKDGTDMDDMIVIEDSFGDIPRPCKIDFIQMNDNKRKDDDTISVEFSSLDDLPDLVEHFKSILEILKKSV